MRKHRPVKEEDVAPNGIDAGMDCPNCKAPMVKGEAFHRKALSNFMLFGFGSTDLCFRPEEEQVMELGSRKRNYRPSKNGSILVMPASAVRRAYMCYNCGTITIATTLATL